MNIKHNLETVNKTDPGKGSKARIDSAFIYPPWAVVDGRAWLQNSLPPLGILSIASYLESLNYY